MSSALALDCMMPTRRVFAAAFGVRSLQAVRRALMFLRWRVQSKPPPRRYVQLEQHGGLRAHYEHYVVMVH